MSATQVFRSQSVDPRYVEDDALPTIVLVQTYVPGFKPEVRINQKVGGWWSFKLPCPAKAEYGFNLQGELGGERQISARLIQFDEDLHSRFWYTALEMAGYRDDASRLQKDFHELVEGLLLHPTRIVEKRGVLWLSHRAAYKTDTGWQGLGGGANLGLGLGIPFVGKKRVYTSPPIVSGIKK
jgi:hypothetical protein